MKSEFFLMLTIRLYHFFSLAFYKFSPGLLELETKKNSKSPRETPKNVKLPQKPKTVKFGQNRYSKQQKAYILDPMRTDQICNFLKFNGKISYFIIFRFNS